MEPDLLSMTSISGHIIGWLRLLGRGGRDGLRDLGIGMWDYFGGNGYRIIHCGMVAVLGIMAWLIESGCLVKSRG